MAKQLGEEPSPFMKLVDLKRARDSQPSDRLAGQMADTPSQLYGGTARSKLAKSTDPSYTKFTTYVRKTTHRAAKLRAVGEGRELSDVVEELISRWAAERTSAEAGPDQH